MLWEVPVQIRQQLATASTKRYGGVNPASSITVHETANLTVGASAAMHANLQSRGNTRNASWQWQVDDVEAVQSFEHTTQCWHAGDGRGPGNLTSIAIEICVNADGDFVHACRNAAELVRKIRGIEHDPRVPVAASVAAVVEHNAWSGKDCPNFLRDGSRGVTWAQFLAWCDADPDIHPRPAGRPPAPAPVPTAPEEDDIMAKLPLLDWRTQHHAYDADAARAQALLKVAGHYDGLLDGKAESRSQAGLAAFQVAHHCGGADGRADLLAGPRTWESLLTGKVW